MKEKKRSSSGQFYQWHEMRTVSLLEREKKITNLVKGKEYSGSNLQDMHKQRLFINERMLVVFET